MFKTKQVDLAGSLIPHEAGMEVCALVTYTKLGN